MAKTPAKVIKKNIQSQKAKPVKNAPTTRPPTSVMVNAAIKDLKERGGSSVYAIKKYISANYVLDAEKFAPYIKKYIKSAVENGTLIQTKGVGATGSFKLPRSTATAKEPKTETKSSKEKTVAVSSSSKIKIKAKSVKKDAEGSNKKSKTASKKVSASANTKKVIVMKTKSPLKGKKVPKVSTKKSQALKSPIKKPLKKVGTKKPIK